MRVNSAVADLSTVSQVAWPLIANFSCPQNAAPGTCSRSDNMGWRYLLFTLGGVTLFLWALRFFVFNLEESPRYLIGLGKDEEAVAVIQRIAAFNGRSCGLTVDDLIKAGEDISDGEVMKAAAKGRKIISQSSSYTIDHIKALFKTKKLAWSTSLLISLWGIYYQSFKSIIVLFIVLQASSDWHLRSTTTFFHTSLRVVELNSVIVPTTLHTVMLVTSILPVFSSLNKSCLLTASYSRCNRYTRCIFSRLGSRTALHRPKGYLGDLRGQVMYFLFHVVSLFNDPPRKIGLSGAFLFATTTARSSNALLGWNCG